jgi:curli biogenesis system outer membrane secretion channel CsgG
MKQLVSIAAIALLCSGCLMVPKTSITGTLGGQPFSLASPKDSTLVGLRLEAATNGTMQLRIERLECRMNPDVVSMTGKAQVDLVNAVAAGVSNAAAEAAKRAVVQ